MGKKRDPYQASKMSSILYVQKIGNFHEIPSFFIKNRKEAFKNIFSEPGNRKIRKEVGPLFL